ncbi:MAG TPA: DNA recombination protein RmuC [candidate division Zixibacteria bacterium]|nr:DNA recombination protein RmuC [candidate division Zixibacteria bacterium]
MEFITAFVVGIIVGGAAVLAVGWIKKREAKAVAQELLSQTQAEKLADLNAIIDNLKVSFDALSLNALSRNTDQFMKLAQQTLSGQTQAGGKELEGKKQLIDQTLEGMKSELEKVTVCIQTLEKDRENKFGELSAQLKMASENNRKLHETAEQLKLALVNSKTRGQWGERMAEDVLRLAGFMEGINYKKQREFSGNRPDFTFLLPRDKTLNMDVKFPFDNYLRYLEATSEIEKESYKSAFFKDVWERVREVTTRDYINPEAQTLDYMLVFIPNEQVYGFILENRGSFIDDALRSKVILCSPLTLYAILSVIRQSIDNFQLEQGASRILGLMGKFAKQWDEFMKAFEKMGKRIEDAQKEFDALATTRRTQLERPLAQIEELRRQRGIAEGEWALGPRAESSPPGENN